MHEKPPTSPTRPSAAPPGRPKREVCSQCGLRLGRKWGPGRLTLVRYCVNERCEAFGLPSLRHVKIKVVIEDDGQMHVRHKEAYSHRGSRPDFVQPA